MSLPSKLSLFLCLLVHTQLVFCSNWIGSSTQGIIPVVWNLFLGVSYLLYPLCGWIAEVCVTNFKMIKLSVMVLLISSISMFLVGLWTISFPPPPIRYLYIAIIGLILVTGVAGLGMYEANAIQFGMDQMIEASSEQLSSFIHWYFWCVNVGPLIQYYVAIGMLFHFSDCVFDRNLANGFTPLIGWVFLVCSSFQIVLTFSGIVMNSSFKTWFSLEETSRNHLKNIFGVLKYAYKHRCPERRSAFTYWENDIPSRIDLAKEKYGGPYTYEQVEDVKTMFRLLILMGSLYGFHLSGDGYSLTYYFMNTIGCPDIVPLSTMIVNPQHITLLIAVFCIPLYHFTKKKLSPYIPTLLTRLWVGLLFCLLGECIQCISSLLLNSKGFPCSELYNNKLQSSLSLKCMVANLRVLDVNDSCQYYCITPPVHDRLFYLSIVPLLLNGLSYLLVFVTTIEFICAQSPNALKGLLIGIWYSMLSLKYMVTNILDIYPPLLKPNSWSIYHCIKGLGMFLSLFFFFLVCKHYQYRKRDEVINQQAMIEEQYERELLINSSLEQNE